MSGRSQSLDRRYGSQSFHRQVGSRKEAIYCYTFEESAESDPRVDHTDVKILLDMTFRGNFRIRQRDETRFQCPEKDIR